TIDKMNVWHLQGKPFRLAIAGATNSGTYADQLQNEIAATLLSLNSFNLKMISDALADSLTSFYTKHIWPRPAGDRPQIEYLLVVQPLPSGFPEVFHVSETAVNIMG